MDMRARNLMRVITATVLTVRGLLALVLGCLLLAAPAAAQFWGDPFQQRRPPRPIRNSSKRTRSAVGSAVGRRRRSSSRTRSSTRPLRPRPQVGNSSKAPAPRKADTPPTTNILVMGDAMADWLGHGLEEAYADNPEFGVVRKIRANSGLLRNELAHRVLRLGPIGA